MWLRRSEAVFAAAALIALSAGSGCVFAQGRGGPEWAGAAGDAQRSGWMRTDPKISADTMAKPGFGLMWKVKFRNDARQGNALSAPILMDRYIGYRGFRSYAFVGGSSDNVFTLDSDLGRIEWQKHFPLTVPAGTAACPGGMTASVARAISAPFPAAPGGRGPGGGGRGGPAKSGVGAPLEGAVTLQAAAPQPIGFDPGGRGRAGRAPAAFPARMPTFLYALSSDGALHAMYISNGEEPKPPVRFLPANANAGDLAVVDEVAYTLTTGGCAGVANGVWALDTRSGSVATWKGDVVGAGPAFGPDGTLYVATAAGDLVALEPKTLNKKASYAAGQPLAAAPVVFEGKSNAMVAIAAADGSVHVLDASLSGTALKSTPAGTVAGSLAAWQDAKGARWILEGAGRSVTALKVGENGLEPGWKSADLGGAVSLAVVNGVVFAATSGDAKTHATLYAFDGGSGKQLWSSGAAITSFVPHGGGLAIGGSSVYLGTHDGTLWAFGFPIEH